MRDRPLLLVLDPLFNKSRLGTDMGKRPIYERGLPDFDLTKHHTEDYDGVVSHGFGRYESGIFEIALSKGLPCFIHVTDPILARSCLDRFEGEESVKISGEYSDLFEQVYEHFTRPQ